MISVHSGTLKDLDVSKMSLESESRVTCNMLIKRSGYENKMAGSYIISNIQLYLRDAERSYWLT